MPTSNELRVQAKDCLDLARDANDFYVKIALKELAQRFQDEAQQIEQRKT
jgi:hypothetical protein